MKKIKIMISMFVILFLLISNVFADSESIIITGDNEVKTGERKKVTVKIISDEEIGMISGKIAKNEKIESITVAGKNNWNLTYNSSTGVFNMYKAEGATDEEIMQIEYVAGNNEGTGKITLGNLNLTSINYETSEIGTVEKQITIKAENTQGQDDNQGTQTGDETNQGQNGEGSQANGGDNEGQNGEGSQANGEDNEGQNGEVPQTSNGNNNGQNVEVPATNNESNQGQKNGDTQNDNENDEKNGNVQQSESNKENINEEDKQEKTNDLKTVEKENTIKGAQNNTINSEKTLPKAGNLFKELIIIFTCLAVVMAFIFYKKYRKYKNV